MFLSSMKMKQFDSLPGWSFNLDFPLFLQILKASKTTLLPQEDQTNHTLQKMAVLDLMM